MGNLIFNSKDSMQNLIKLVNEAAEAVGKVFGGGKGTGAFVLAAPVAALIVSGVTDYIDDKQQKQIQERLENSGAKIYSTQENGAFGITVNKKSMRIHGRNG